MPTILPGDELEIQGKSSIRPPRKLQNYEVDRICPMLDEYRFFTVAPLYLFANVHVSVADQFEASIGEEIPRILVTCRNLIFTGLKAWDNVLEAVAVDRWKQFAAFASNMWFADPDRQSAWTLHWKDILIDRPLPEDPGRALGIVRVFLPTGNRGHLTCHPGQPTSFKWEKPQASISEVVPTVLNQTRR